jgi:hypothetical protein
MGAARLDTPTCLEGFTNGFDSHSFTLRENRF